MLMNDKKGQTGGLITGLVFGVASLVIGIIIAFVIVTTITGAGLLTGGSVEDNAVTNLSSNFSSGVDNISSKIPTVFTVAAVVLLLTVLALLFAVWMRMRLGGGGTL